MPTESDLTGVPPQDPAATERKSDVTSIGDRKLKPPR